MKTAIVNLSQKSDVGEWEILGRGVKMLLACGYPVVDYASGRVEPHEMVAGLHAAIADPEVGVVLTASGGSALIECLDLIDWDRVGQCGKVFAGISDFTHFAWMATAAGARCVYGLALQPLAEFWAGTDNMPVALDFLQSGEVLPLAPQLVHGDDIVQDWSSQSIVGGHTFITYVMLTESPIDLQDHVLLLEHHYNASENIDGLRYWATAIARKLRTNRPKAILLGHSMVLDAIGQPVSVETCNAIFMEQLSELNVAIYYTDHFTTLVELGIRK